MGAPALDTKLLSALLNGLPLKKLPFKLSFVLGRYRTETAQSTLMAVVLLLAHFPIRINPVTILNLQGVVYLLLNTSY